MTERNVCYEAFARFCDDLDKDNDRFKFVDEAQYWIFEQGFRAAVHEFMQIVEQGKQDHEFSAPGLQKIAEKILASTKK